MSFIQGSSSQQARSEFNSIGTITRNDNNLTNSAINSNNNTNNANNNNANKKYKFIKQRNS